MRSKLLGYCLILALSAWFVGCVSVGIGSGGGRQLTQISVTPSGAGIPVGTTQQFTATGTYSDGSQRNINPNVTWSSSPAGLVTIDTSGLATAVAAGQVTVTATSGSISNAAPLTVNPPALLSVSVAPLGPAIEVGSAIRLSATGHYTDGSTQDLTGSVAWTTSVGSVASVANGLVTGIVAGQTTITATSNSFADSTAVNVVPPPATQPGLDGNYVFSFTGVDTRGAQFYAGIFHATPPDASGNGTIDSGQEDANTSAGVTNSALTGTYTVYPDGRGTLVLTPAGGTSTTLRFILAASGATGLAIEFDGLGTAAGSFELQDAGPFGDIALTGDYVFRFNGMDIASTPMGEVGVFTADGLGNISGGAEDENDFGVLSSPALTASLYDIGANGRGTLALTTAGGTSNFVVYAVSATKLRLMQTDAASTVLSGVAEQQANNNFTNTALMGGYAYRLDRAPSANQGTFDVIGRAFFDGNQPTGNVVAGTQLEVDGTTQNTITGGTYNIAANGRGVIAATTDAGERDYTIYMISPSRAYLLENFTTWGGTGSADVQNVTLDNSTLSGSYALSGASIGQNDTALSLWLNADGGGNIAGVADVISGGIPSSVVVGNTTYNVTPNGRTFVTLPSPSPIVVQSFTFYVVSPTEAQILGSQPALDGVLLLQ